MEKILPPPSELIPGILLSSSRALRRRGKKTYREAVPENSSYPSFLVSVRKTFKHSMYILFKFEETVPDYPFPFGSLVQVFGPEGDKEAERAYFLARNNLKLKDWRQPLKFKEEILKYAAEDPFSSERINLEALKVFSIDPEGCLDIDDALHFKETSIGWEVGIHIADVASYLPVGSSLDLWAREKGVSLYFPKSLGLPFLPMLPLLEEKASLLPGKRRRAFSLILSFSSSFKLLETNFVHTSIRNRKAWSYEEAEAALDKNSELLALKTFSTSYFDPPPVSTHTLIALWMKEANKLCASRLLATSSPGIFRIQKDKGIPLPETSSFYSSLIYHLQTGRAKYGTKEESSLKHTGLKISAYTHFTSPLRRFADLTVHRILSSVLPEESNLSILCEHLNQKQKEAKQAERSALLLEFLLLYKEVFPLQTEGRVVGIEETHILLFLPAFSFLLPCPLFSKAMFEFIERISSKTSVSFIRKDKPENKLKLSLEQEVSLQIVFSASEGSFSSRLRVQLLDPDPLALLISSEIE